MDDGCGSELILAGFGGLDGGGHRTFAGLDDGVGPEAEDLIAFEFSALFVSGFANDSAGTVDDLRHEVGFLDGLAEETGHHFHDVGVGMMVVIMKDDMPGHRFFGVGLGPGVGVGGGRIEGGSVAHTVIYRGREWFETINN